MAEISRFFNSIDHDRMYSAADWAAYFAAFIGNGVMPLPSSQLVVSAGTGAGLSLSVAAGRAFVGGYMYENTDDKALTLETASGTYPRVDRVVVRYSRTAREIFLAAVTGTPANDPVPPALTRTADVYDLCLAEVSVARGADSLTNADITDTRGDSSVCGFVSWLFSSAGNNYDYFWQQYRTKFYAWMEDMSEQLDPATMAGIAQRFAEITPKGVQVTLTPQGWDSTYRTQTLYVQEILANSYVVVCPAPASRDAYAASVIACTAQGNGTLTFAAKDIPADNVTVNLLIYF